MQHKKATGSCYAAVCLFLRILIGIESHSETSTKYSN